MWGEEWTGGNLRLVQGSMRSMHVYAYVRIRQLVIVLRRGSDAMVCITASLRVCCAAGLLAFCSRDMHMSCLGKLYAC